MIFSTLVYICLFKQRFKKDKNFFKIDMEKNWTKYNLIVKSQIFSNLEFKAILFIKIRDMLENIGSFSNYFLHQTLTSSDESIIFKSTQIKQIFISLKNC